MIHSAARTHLWHSSLTINLCFGPPLSPHIVWVGSFFTPCIAIFRLNTGLSQEKIYNTMQWRICITSYNTSVSMYDKFSSLTFFFMALYYIFSLLCTCIQPEDGYIHLKHVADYHLQIKLYLDLYICFNHKSQTYCNAFINRLSNTSNFWGLYISTLLSHYRSMSKR